MSQPSLILASGSAIRREILDGAGLSYEVIIRPVDEAAIKEAMLAENARLRDIADALAEAKAMRVSRQMPGLVIGADQIMVMKNDAGQDQLFDKPKDMDEVRERLLSMRGKKHELVGAVVICENGMPVWRHLSRTSQLFEKVDGGFFAILGLDLLPVLDYLRTRGMVLR